MFKNKAVNFTKLIQLNVLMPTLAQLYMDIHVAHSNLLLPMKAHTLMCSHTHTRFPRALQISL